MVPENLKSMVKECFWRKTVWSGKSQEICLFREKSWNLVGQGRVREFSRWEFGCNFEQSKTNRLLPIQLPPNPRIIVKVIG